MVERNNNVDIDEFDDLTDFAEPGFGSRKELNVDPTTIDDYKNKYLCVHCDFQTTKKSDLEDHLKTHEQEATINMDLFDDLHSPVPMLVSKLKDLVESIIIQPKNIIFIGCVSSNVAGYGYDEDSRVFEVIFNTGATYRYYNIPKKVFETIRKAPSIGKALNILKKGSVYKKVN